MSKAIQLANFLAGVIDHELTEPNKMMFREFMVYNELRKLMEQSETMSSSFDLRNGAAADLIESFRRKLKVGYLLLDENIECFGLPVMVWLELIDGYHDSCCYSLDEQFYVHLLAFNAKFEAKSGQSTFQD